MSTSFRTQQPRQTGEPRTFSAESYPLLSPTPAPAHNIATWFETDPTPILLVAPDATLIEANPAGLQLLAEGACFSVRNYAVAFIEAEANRSFLQALADVVARRSWHVGIVLRGNDGAWRKIELQASQTSDVFVSFRCEPQEDMDIAPLISAFHLTPSEGEVLRRLAQGLSPKEIARDMAASTNTVRAHLRTLYLKTHARGIPGLIRQAMRLTH